MPDCPNCHIELGFGSAGGICPKCLTVYSPAAVKRMPGYDNQEVLAIAALYAFLYEAGLMKRGINEVDFVDDAMILTHKEALD